MKRMVVLVLVAVAAWQAAAFAGPKQPAAVLSFTFYFTHYVLLGDDPANPTGVRYESTGAPFADNPKGARIAISGSGGWDPAGSEATGGGDYVVTNADGDVKAEGTWTVQEFVSFLQLPGWWGIDGFVEEGWQGPAGSPSFAGFLKVRIELEDGRTGLLTTWCVMPETPHRGGHVSDGVSLEGEHLNFTDSTENEMGLEGVMFYGP